MTKVEEILPGHLEACPGFFRGRFKGFVEVMVESVHPAVITVSKIQLAPGIKVQPISGLAKDLARSMAIIRWVVE